MWKRIEEILEGVRKEFSYKSAYKWLFVLVIGIMVRADKLGVTSVIRLLDAMLGKEIALCDAE